MADSLNLLREIRELKNQLAYSKNIGFFFGSGTSCALGIPNIVQLTQAVRGELEGDFLNHFESINNDLKTTINGREPNVEDVLDYARKIRDITQEQATKDYLGITGKAAKDLDIEICHRIYQIILTEEKKANLDLVKKFFAWLNIVGREFSKEVFTTNYDLIIEKSLEASDIPYFDGFVGSYEPFFWQDSIDRIVTSQDLTWNWIRLWKIHGSLSWFWKEDLVTKAQKIIRIGKVEQVKDGGNELVIYPSKEKYNSSRKQPFVAYFDRLRDYLLSGEILFTFSGYSFSDQHINEIVFNCLRQNNRLTAIVFFYKDEEVKNLHAVASSYMNLIVLGPKTGIVNGHLGAWEFKKDEMKPAEKCDYYWDEANSALTLGDFKSLVNFLITNSGKKEIIESALK